MTMTPTQHAVPSLLHPSGFGARPAGRPAPNEADLGLASIIRALDYDGRHSRFVAGVLAELSADPAVIRYRQDVLDDLLQLPDLVAGFAGVLPQLGELASAGRASSWGENIPLVQVAGRLAELDNYISCVEGLSAALETAGDAASAAGLLALRAFLTIARAQPDYRRLADELPRLRAQLDQAGSVTLGINLDAQLRPDSATIVSINSARFAGTGTLLDRLFGERAAPNAVRGVTALYKADEGHQHTPEHELFRDMSRLLERVAAPVAEALAGYTRVNSAALSGLEPELAFYLGAVRLANELRAAGLALCRPEIAPAAERACAIEGVYSLDLALRLRMARGTAGLAQAVVQNEVAFGPGATIFILTGPNSGGKTTYTRAVGQAQALSQAGLLVPGQRARISPADGIFTLFAAAERLDAGGGRLAEELERLAQIFRQAGRTSLVLLNEPLASTDHGAARVLSRDIVAGLQLLGARAILVTHLHELVDDLLGSDNPAPGVVSMVAGVATRAGNGGEPAPSYTITPGWPRVAGYAAELARQHGLSLAQIAATLRERGIASDTTDSD
jgi:DNA mismatch repair protein MutS